MKEQSELKEEVAADETQAKMDNLASHEKIFFNAVENSVVAVNTETKRLKVLQPQVGEPFDPYKTFATCHLKMGLF